MKITDDPSRLNKFMVMNGYRRAVNPHAVRNYKDQQDLRRKVRKKLIVETRDYIVVDSASAEFQPNTLGQLSPLIKHADFDELIEKLNTLKSDTIYWFEKLFDHNTTWGILFLKYPRKFAYLIHKLP